MSDKLAIPTPKVDAEAAAELAGARASEALAGHDLSLWGMFWAADIVVQLVMVLLFVASFWCWAIIFDKWRRFRMAREVMDIFDELFWSGPVESVKQRFERLHRAGNEDNPLYLMTEAGMREWAREAVSSPVQSSLLGEPSAVAESATHKLERIIRAMEKTRERIFNSYEKNLDFLATVGSTAPFVGLFGTVWGIMNAFQAIAVTKNTTLAVVAPGIAEALFATAIGLFAAIPAVIFYNRFRNQVVQMDHRLDIFVDEFEDIVRQELGS